MKKSWYMWQVYLGKNLIKEFPTFKEMHKFYKKFRRLLRKNELEDLTYCVHWYLLQEE